MIHIFFNGLSATAGGGVTYVRNVVPLLGQRPGVKATVAIPAELRAEFDSWPNVQFLEERSPSNTARRFCWEQTHIPKLVRRSGADVLLSAGNFAIFSSPVPQILLSRNALYISKDFYRDLLQRHEYSRWLDTKIKGILAKRSIRRADVTFAPSETFARELTQWTGVKVAALHHGFNVDRFSQDPGPLPADVAAKLAVPHGTLRLLFVSHYNYYRNFATLFRSLPLLERKYGGRPLELFLTCRLGSSTEPGSYRPKRELEFIRAGGLERMIVELGTIPYSLLHHVYRACDLYVTPAYAETFAHPLVEAMSCGLPVVASDIAVHRETCGEAAAYFAAFSPEGLADAVANVASSVERRATMSAYGVRRAKFFSWDKHVDRILEVALSLKSG